MNCASLFHFLLRCLDSFRFLSLSLPPNKCCASFWMKLYFGLQWLANTVLHECDLKAVSLTSRENVKCTLNVYCITNVKTTLKCCRNKNILERMQYFGSKRYEQETLIKPFIINYWIKALNVARQRIGLLPLHSAEVTLENQHTGSELSSFLVYKNTRSLCLFVWQTWLNVQKDTQKQDSKLNVPQHCTESWQEELPGLSPGERRGDPSAQSHFCRGNNYLY